MAKRANGVFTVLVFVASLIAFGCGGSGGDTDQVTRVTSEPPAERSGGTLRLALERPRSLDPALTDDVYEATISNQVFSGLVQLDANLNVIPDLAESWTISRDQRVFHFKLRDTAQFHNGRYVTAEDFVYSFTRLFKADEIAPGIIQDYLRKMEGVDAFISGDAKRISGIKAADSFTLEITLEHPYPSFLSVLCMDQAKVVPREVVKELGAERFGREPVGTGPFRFKKWDRETELCLVANMDYYGGPPHLDTLQFIHSPEDDPDWEKTSFHSRQLDFIDIREAELSELQEQGPYRVMRRPELSVDFLGFNVQHPLFKDARVRRAIAMALDTNAMQEIAGKGYEPAAGILPPGIPGYTPESKTYSYDPDQARKLLAKAGYTEKKPLRIPMMTIAQSDFGRASDSVLVASLAEAGIVVELQQVTWDEYDQAISDRTATILSLAWIADLPDPDSFLYTLFISDGGSNLFGYSNPAVDSLLVAGSHEADQVGRLKKYRAAEKMILADAPLIPLFNVVRVYVLQEGVQGVELSPFGLCSIPMERIWLDRTRGELHAKL